MAKRMFRRALLGYRAADVEAAIGERDAALAGALERVEGARAEVAELEQVATRLSERVVARERELRLVREELDRARREADDAVRALALLAERLAPASPASPAEENGHRPEASASEIFAGLVEVEVGPLSDFAQLVGFEDAAGGIGGAAEISVKRFTKGRATLELHLSEPVELLRELEERAPFEFRVRDTREDRVVLDVDAE